MTRNSIIAAVENVLQQGLTLLDALDAEIYSRRFDGSSLGAHYRHVLDHFLCLREGINTGDVNYDRRGRDPQLENSIAYARLVTQDLLEEFGQLSFGALQRECIVTYTVGYDDAVADAVPSNLAREATFCVGHAIHHYAILKLLCAGGGVRLPYEFGIAPSTLRHRQTVAGQHS